MELSIDTSTRYASVAISTEGRLVEELIWRSNYNHSTELVPGIRTMLNRSNIDTTHIKTIFVAKGPGGFSALRVGLATAKGLATSLDVPIISISTLDIEVQPYIELNLPTYAIIKAGRDRIYLGKYNMPTNDASPKYQVMDIGELAKIAKNANIICGEGAISTAESLNLNHGIEAQIIRAPEPTRHPSVLAHLGYRKLVKGEIDDPKTLEPILLRSSQINTAKQTLLSK